MRILEHTWNVVGRITVAHVGREMAAAGLFLPCARNLKDVFLAVAFYAVIGYAGRGDRSKWRDVAGLLPEYRCQT